MTKKVHTPETDILIESKGKMESFFDKYGSKLMWGLVAIAVIGIGVFFWLNYADGKNAKAEAAASVKHFEVLNDSNATANTAESFSIDYIT